MALDFHDIQVIDKSTSIAGSVPSPDVPVTTEQQAKLDQLEALVVEVGDPILDTELDILIAAMTEIRDRE